MATNSINDGPTDNVVDLPFKTESAVVDFIERRFLQNETYTWAGQTLIALNPYSDHLNKYVTGRPHVYSIVDKAWMRFANKLGKTNQTLVISGETGSGKTFSMCMAIEYIMKSKQKSVEEFQDALLLQILYSIPLLSAFGNAPTKHNDNSSRFGKLLRLQYKNDELKGAIITPYLLEKSRVTEPNFDEGNFHIFQLMLENLETEELTSFYLDSTVYYKILTTTRNSSIHFEEIIDALEYLKIDEKREIFTILSAILNMGNVDFKQEKEIFTITSESYKFAIYTANLLQTEPDSLIKVMTTRVISAGSRDNKRQSSYCSPCINKQECEEIRNSLMKLLYEKMFIWLINRINVQIGQIDEYDSFGVLDIYGFEVFDNNTFEQLCINYANEKLQHYFINDYLIERQKSYENNVYVEIFENNEYITRMMLLDGHFPSLFSILDEECKIKRYNNDYFINARITEHLKHYPHFIKSSNNFNTFFSIKHFAGVVKYNSTNMVTKNSDKVSDEIVNFLKGCKFKFVENIISVNGDPYDNKGKTLLAKFKKSLDDLMVMLNNTDVHYIKCIKSNEERKPLVFDREFVARQLKIFGIFEILKLSRQNFTIRVSYEEFNNMFAPVSLSTLKDLSKSDIIVGNKHIYLTERGFSLIKSMKVMLRNEAARIIQRKWRKIYQKRKNAAVVIQKYFRLLLIKLQETYCEQFIDVSKKNSFVSIKRDDHDCCDDLNECPNYTSHMKTLEYVESLRNVPNLDGDPLSLALEKIFDTLETEPFTRKYFRDSHVISRLRIAEVPIKIHLSKTCIPYSHMMPLSEIPAGLPDIL